MGFVIPGLLARVAPVLPYYFQVSNELELNKIEQEVLALEELGVLRECDKQMLKSVQPLKLVKKDDGKSWRLIYCCEALNDVIPDPPSFSLPGPFKTPCLGVGVDHLAAVIDAKKGFFSIEVAPESYQWLGMEVKGRYFHFLRLPMGLKWSPFVFSAFTEEVAEEFRRVEGVSGVEVYLDDWCITTDLRSAESRDLLLLFLFKLMKGLGLEVAAAKTQPFASKVVWLGLVVDIHRNLVYMTRERKFSLTRELKKMMKLAETGGSVPLKTLAGVVGKVVFVSRLVPGALIDLKPISSLVAGFAAWKGWRSSIHLKPERSLDFKQVLTAVTAAKAVPLRPPRPSWAVDTDASLEGWGAVLKDLRTKEEVVRSEPWTKWGEKQEEYIGLLELRAFFKLLNSHTDIRAGSLIWRTDSRVALSWVLRQTGSWQARSVLKKLLLLLAERRLFVRPYWLSTKDNWRADLLSRNLPSRDDLRLKEDVRTRLWTQLGVSPHSLEMWAHPLTKVQDNFQTRRGRMKVGGPRDALEAELVTSQAHPAWVHPPPSPSGGSRRIYWPGGGITQWCYIPIGSGTRSSD